MLFTQDEDFLGLAAALQTEGTAFPGIIYAHQERVSIGTCIEDLHLMATAMDAAEISGCVQYLPL